MLNTTTTYCQHLRDNGLRYNHVLECGHMAEDISPWGNEDFRERCAPNCQKNLLQPLVDYSVSYWRTHVAQALHVRIQHEDPLPCDICIDLYLRIFPDTIRHDIYDHERRTRPTWIFGLPGNKIADAEWLQNEDNSRDHARRVGLGWCSSSEVETSGSTTRLQASKAGALVKVDETTARIVRWGLSKFPDPTGARKVVSLEEWEKQKFVDGMRNLQLQDASRGLADGGTQESEQAEDIGDGEEDVDYVCQESEGEGDDMEEYDEENGDDKGMGFEGRFQPRDLTVASVSMLGAEDMDLS